MSIAQTIHGKLTKALTPGLLEITDESAKHHGHSGARPEGESHFHIQIVSPHFIGLTRVERHRLINNLLAEELRFPIHALSLATLTPDEYGNH